MLCQKCHQRPASVFFSQIVGDQTTQAHLCEPCAQEQSQAGGGALPLGFNPFTALSSFLNSFMGMGEGAITEVGSGRAGSVAVDPQAQCPHCGYQLATFRQNGRLGCTKCYESFKPFLGPLLARIHGNVRHVEEGPAAAAPPEGVERRSERPEIRALRARIDEAVKGERYEEAARLRDEVRKLENT